MTILTTGARRTVRQRTPWAVDPTNRWPAAASAIAGDTTPYAMPTVAPFNVPTPCPTPNVHGEGQAMHPSVVDFHGQWNGYRFWMAMTPLTGNNEGKENPCILASNDGHSWVEPAGIVNPIEAWRGYGYHSDTDLEYDPDGRRLVCYWRTVVMAESGWGQRISAAWSTDGVNWSTPVTLIPEGTHFDTRILSPCIVRRGPGDWWMFTQRRDAGDMGMLVFRSPSPLSWAAPPVEVPVTISWHAGITWDGSAFRGIGGGELASSSDGYAWSTGAPVLVSRQGMWDAYLYRATLTVMDGSTMRVWYSAHNAVAPYEWRTGYTHIPRALWPAPPA